MMRSLFSGVSGLKSHQTRMDVIGNNIANVNTAGYKYSRTTFADTLSQTLTGASSPNGNIGGTNAKQIGLGVSVASIDQIMGDGSPQSTGKNTDLAISGNGFFVVERGGSTYYTRDGAFEFDESGDYVLPGSGLRVQGWNLKAGETEINTTGATETVNVMIGKSMEASQTETTEYVGNINSNQVLTVKSTSSAGADQIQYHPVSTAAATGTYVLDLDAKSGHPKNSITTTVTAFDSYGESYNIPVLLFKAEEMPENHGNGTVWYAMPLNVEDETTGQTVVNVGYVDTFTPSGSLNTSGTLYTAFNGATAGVSSGSIICKIEFDQYGRLKDVDGDGMPDDVVMNIGADILSGASTTIGTVATNTSAGVTTTQQNFTLTFAADSFTQFAGSNTVHQGSTPGDGNAAGTLTSISIDTTGVITGIYSNGKKQPEAQVAIAQFTNSAGLTRTSNSLFQESNNSGKPNVKTAGDLGVSLTPSALEMSNVDVANEFSEMIITQRGFQSNSKIITVGDEMLETVINMKR